MTSQLCPSGNLPVCPRTDFCTTAVLSIYMSSTAKHEGRSLNKGGKLRPTEGTWWNGSVHSLQGRWASWLCLQYWVTMAPAVSLVRLSSRPCVSHLLVARTDQSKAQGHSALTYGGQAGHAEPCECWVPVPINCDFLIKPLGKARWLWAAGPLSGPLD